MDIFLYANSTHTMSLQRSPPGGIVSGTATAEDLLRQDITHAGRTIAWVDTALYKPRRCDMVGVNLEKPMIPCAT